MMSCLVDGELSTYVPADDRGFAYGDGVFESFCVVRGVPRFWAEHMERLTRGCQRLGIAIPDEDLLRAEVRTVSLGLDRCVVKIVVTRGSGGRGYLPEAGATPLRVVSSHAFPSHVEEAARRGIRMRICEIRLGIQPVLGGLKHLNRLEQVLAARELGEADDDGLLMDRDGHVIGGIASNLFLVSGPRLLTPRMDRCGVRGVVRGLILRDFKPRCELRRVTPDMLNEADELFVCNSVRGVLPVTWLQDREWAVGPVTRELQKWFRQRAEET